MLFAAGTGAAYARTQTGRTSMRILLLSVSLSLVLSPPRGLLGISSEFLCSPVGGINDCKRHVHNDSSTS